MVAFLQGARLCYLTVPSGGFTFSVEIGCVWKIQCGKILRMLCLKTVVAHQGPRGENRRASSNMSKMQELLEQRFMPLGNIQQLQILYAISKAVSSQKYTPHLSLLEALQHWHSFKEGLVWLFPLYQL